MNHPLWADPSMNGLVFPRPSLHEDLQFKTLKPRDLRPKPLNFNLWG